METVKLKYEKQEQDKDDKTIKWVNYRCNKCGKIISFECEYIYGIPNHKIIKIIDHDSALNHGCDLKDGENPIIIAMSTSKEPLKNAAQIIYL